MCFYGTPGTTAEIMAIKHTKNDLVRKQIEQNKVGVLVRRAMGPMWKLFDSRSQIIPALKFLSLPLFDSIYI